ncbi:MAG: hypothetical protein ACN4GW_18235 [Desulforhopalus sp.]
MGEAHSIAMPCLTLTFVVMTYMIRHAFGFLRGLIDFSLDKFEKAIKLTEEVSADEAPEIIIPPYDRRGMEAIGRNGLGMYKDDPLTTANIGKIFVD